MSHDHNLATDNQGDDSARCPSWDEWVCDVEREMQRLGGVPEAEFLILAERLYARLMLDHTVTWQSRNSLGSPRKAARKIYEQALTLDLYRRERARRDEEIAAERDDLTISKAM